MDLIEIAAAGRAAFGAGASRMDNPYFTSELMPRATGESFEEWQRKINAWEDGWYAAERMANFNADH